LSAGERGNGQAVSYLFQTPGGERRILTRAKTSVKDDPDFGPELAERTTIDIKDKYRNLVTKKRNAPANEKCGDPVKSFSAGAGKEETILERGPVTTDQTITNDSPRKRAKKEDISKSSVLADPVKCEKDMKQGTLMTSSSSSSSSNHSANKDSMTLTVQCEQRTLILNLKGTTKASQLLSFAQKEFRVGDGYVLVSAGVGTQLELSRSIRDQVPMFDLLRVVCPRTENVDRAK